MGRERQGTGGETHGDLVSVELGFAGLRQLEEGFAANLAEDGVFVPCDAPLPPSTVVRLRIVLAGEVLLLQATGVVFWSRTASDRSGPAGMAIRFVTMAPEFEETVRELLDARRRRGLAVPRLDHVAMATEWPEVAGGERPWERPEIGYRLRVRRSGEAPADEVTQLRFFSDEAEGAPPPRAGDGRVAAEADEPRSPAPPPAASTATPRRPTSTGSAPRPTGGDPGEEDAGTVQAPGVAFEVSFFDDDGSPDTTPRLGDSHGPEVVIDLDGAGDGEDERPTWLQARLRKIRDVLPSPLLVLEIVVILAVLWGTKWVVSRVASIGLRPGPASTAAGAPTPTRGVHGEGSTAATAAPVTQEETARAGVVDSGGEVPEAAIAAPAPSGTPARTPTASPTATSAPRPTATPARAPPAAAAGALAVRDVSWTRRDGRTTVSVQADQALPRDAVTVAVLSGPPRVLVAVRGVVRPFGRSLLQVGSREVETLRIGYHPDHDPPSLHVVLDLGDPGVGLLEQRVEGDRIVVTVGR